LADEIKAGRIERWFADARHDGAVEIGADEFDRAGHESG
jgi:hypothetical protein